MQVSPSVSQKPPALPEGVNSLWAWLVATFSVSDLDLLNSCGLDALMMVSGDQCGSVWISVKPHYTWEARYGIWGARPH